MRIAILGSGVVGQALATGYPKHGHEVRIGTRQSEVGGHPVDSPAGAAAWGDVVVLAVKGEAAVELATSVKDEVAGKVVIDTTNPLDFSTGAPALFVGWNDSLGEQVQRAAPRAKVVKAYNTVGNTLMVDPELPGGPPTMLIAGDDDGAKATVTALLTDTGWEVSDLGGIDASRHLEAICMAWVLHGVRTGTWDHAFKLLSK
ncbi:MAG: putative oxidoreductase, coenzyme F420-dependent [Frankiales bacterium]|jgi:predicted dinucleotide-binding enzyme|nr:putative oxidoreductase, coenzyme F420-dependent [Frankiales bacterium]